MRAENQEICFPGGLFGPGRVVPGERFKVVVKVVYGQMEQIVALACELNPVAFVVIAYRDFTIPGDAAVARVLVPEAGGIGVDNQRMAAVIGMFFKALTDHNMSGAYNAVSPKPVNNAEFTRVLAQVLNKRIWLPNVPAFVLKTLLGERASLVLKGSRVSSKKIESTGYDFEFTSLEPALKNLLSSWTEVILHYFNLSFLFISQKSRDQINRSTLFVVLKFIVCISSTDSLKSLTIKYQFYYFCENSLKYGLRETGCLFARI